MSSTAAFLQHGVAPRGRAEKVTGQYRTYRWKPGVLASNIRSGRLTPIAAPSPERTHANAAACSICYNYFPAMNEAECCANRICTECIAACIAPPGEAQSCPFCRRAGFSVRAGVAPAQLRIADADDSQFARFARAQREGFDFERAQGCSDEAIAIALQYRADPRAVEAQLRAKVPIDEIIPQLAAAPAGARPPPSRPVIQVSDYSSEE